MPNSAWRPASPSCRAMIRPQPWRGSPLGCGISPACAPPSWPDRWTPWNCSTTPRAATTATPPATTSSGPSAAREDPLCAAVEEYLTRLAQRYQSHVVQWRASSATSALPKALLVRSLAGGARACTAVLKWSYLRGQLAAQSVYGRTLHPLRCGRSHGLHAYASGVEIHGRSDLRGARVPQGLHAGRGRTGDDVAESGGHH